MRIFAKNRWQAFGIHLLISLVIFISLSAVIYFLWYPGFLFHYDGGLQGMKLIAGVDFFIGPILTLAIYNLEKKSLRFDLACIAILQLACLAGGMWTVWHTRPIAVVYAAGEFSTTNQLAYENAKIRIQDVPLIVNSSWPVWVAVDVPQSAEKSLQQVWGMMGSGLNLNVENYVPYNKVITDLSTEGKSYSEVADELKLQWEKNPEESVRFYPVTTSMYSGHLAIDTKTGKVIEAIF